ncbi:protein MpNAC1 [Marchantia polymorpha subsp. ruderalis]|nr:hypothetical protein MARPO_0015s0058 [Marchantia polymorpha]BBN01483.1 hypothetical protein Mp_2g07720 [Marchantia polymorpha subsp. ruderalis]|eukprot:PTQ45250.1 hypothetical protein MARPO_0015s0058 [Marchantia polymorpha]
MPDDIANYNFQDFCTIPKVEVVDERDDGSIMGSRLPPGFRFHPTDFELVDYYLTIKVKNNQCHFEAIDEVNLNKCEPWDLPAKAKVGENTWYFFSLRDRKYPTGMRTNRATDAGYWKATGKDREVMTPNNDRLVGMKKTLVFYTGRAPKGEKTNWIMHEYRIEGESSPVTEWVVCRVFKKNAACRKSAMECHPGGSNYQLELDEPEGNFDHQAGTYLPALLDSPGHHHSQQVPSSHKPGYGGFSGTPSSAEYHQGGGATYHAHHEFEQQQQQHDLGQKLQKSKSFSLADFSTFTNWAVRRDMQVADTLENLVGNWDAAGPESSNNSEEWIWDPPAG